MTFLITCPNCGPREALEFAYGGEVSKRPAPDSSDEELSSALFFRENAMGRQTEWWIHWNGCRRWFLAERSTVSNEIATTYWPSDRESPAAARAEGEPAAARAEGSVEPPSGAEMA